jgi:hypothetical protein
MAEVDDLRAELADAEAALAELPQADECQCAGPHEALTLTEERYELAQRIDALRTRLDRVAI